MSDEMPEMEWSEQTAALAAVMAADALRPWFEMLEGWVNQAKERGYTDEQARFMVSYAMGWRPAPADGGELA